MHHLAPRRPAAAVLLLALMPAAARAQGDVPAAGLVLERTITERWLHGRQQPAFTVPTERRETVGVDPALAFQPPRLQRDAEWSDTLVVADGGSSALRGTRVSVLTRDTLVGGRRLWWVRDSARVHYRERREPEERTLGRTVVLEREGTGTLTGVHLYDPALQRYRVRHDTLTVTGAAELRYPDGRTFRTPARYERTQRTVLVDTATLRALRAEEEAARRRARGGMVVRVPEETRTVAQALAEGDTAWAAAWLRDNRYGSLQPMETATLRLLLPFLEDPGLAFDFGLERDPFYENPAQGLLQGPPAALPDTALGACTPEACALLAAQAESAAEPRLRALGLIARMVMQPVPWADSVIAGAERGTVFLERALPLARGDGGPWRRVVGFPAPGAPWETWHEWLGTDRNPPPPLPGETPLVLKLRASMKGRFDRGVQVKLRFQELRTGRDLARELQRGMADARSDSARLIFGGLLLALDAYRPDTAVVAARFRSGSAADSALARAELHHLFRIAARPADTASAAEVLELVLTRWAAGANEGTFIVEDDLPPAVRDRWRSRIRMIARDEAPPVPPGTDTSVHHVERIEQVGPFVRIETWDSSMLARPEGDPPHAYASGSTLYLVREGGRWVELFAESWIT